MNKELLQDLNTVYNGLNEDLDESKILLGNVIENLEYLIKVDKPTPLKENTGHILTEEQYISIKFFDSTGLEKVADLTGLDYEELEFEQENGNYFIGQAQSKKYFLFCISDSPMEEITFTEFERRCR